MRKEICGKELNENDKPLISVVIPVYNAEKYLDRCIASVANQNYKNLEILLVDDGSTDNSGKMCDDWKKKDPRVRVCHKKNEGPGIARNTGIQIAGGGYITFVDSDDWVESPMYEKMLEVAIKTESDIVGCPSVIDFDDGSHKENHLDVPEGYINKNQCIVDFLEGNKHAWGAVHNKIYKRRLWETISFPAVKHLEDYAVSARLFNEANSIWFCTHPYYHHTCNIFSLSMSGWNPGRLTIPETTDMIIDYLRRNCPEPSVIKATYRFRFLMDLDILWSVYKGKPKDVKEIKKSLRSRSMAGLCGYVAYARKKKSDVKQLIKFILSLVG